MGRITDLLNEEKKADTIIFFKSNGDVHTTEDVTGTPLKNALKIAKDFMKKTSKIVGYTIHDADEKIIARGGSKE